MRIMITGGAGFQGSHLAEYWLQAGHDVTLLNTYSREAEQNSATVAKQSSVVWGSVTDREIVEKTARGHDVLVHLAARINVDESIDDPMIFLTVNVLGTMNVLEAARKFGTRVIYASSCEVYGFAEGAGVTEQAELRPHSPYAASKAGADRLCFAYHKTYGLDVTILRACNIYGERQKSGRGGAVIPIFASQALAGKPLTVFGAGRQRREYMHVSDLVAAYDLVFRRSDLAGVALNVGTAERPSIKQIAEFISAKTNVPIEYGPPRSGDVLGFMLDSSRARKLGFDPQVKFWDGLSRYLECGEISADASHHNLDVA